MLSLFSSFGYFDEAGNEKTVAAVSRALRPGGVFFLDIWNKNKFVADLAEKAQPKEIKDGRVLQHYMYDAANSTVIGTKKLILRGEIRTHRFFLRLYSPGEITEMMERHSLRVTDFFGDYDGSVYSEASTRMLILAEKLVE